MRRPGCGGNPRSRDLHAAPQVAAAGRDQGSPWSPGPPLGVWLKPPRASRSHWVWCGREAGHRGGLPQAAECGAACGQRQGPGCCSWRGRDLA